MTELAQNINFLLALATVVLEIATVTLVVLLVRERFTRREIRFLNTLGRYALHIVFLVSLSGTAMSLVYSEILGFLPCGLCWIQRIFLYPQVILSGMGIWKRDRSVADYLLGLSIPGAFIALYQHYLQMGGTSLLPCPAVAADADCAQRFLFEFGHVTFPFMALVAFVFIIVLMIVFKTRRFV